MYRWVVYFIGFILPVSLGAQVAAPDVRCISVDANGDVTVQWIPPADPANQFVLYMVGYGTNPAGPFTEDPVVGIATTTFNRVTNADVVRQYYYVKTVHLNGAAGTDTVSSDTFSTILPVFQIQTDSNARITWNPIVTPNIPSSSGTYQVFRQMGMDPWQQVGTSPYGTELFDDTFKVCVENIRYRVEIADNSGCRSVSAVIEDQFVDITPPDIPVFDSVTVDTATGDIILNWLPSKAGDTDGYLIVYYDFVSNQYIIRDTVFGIGNTSYIDTLASGNTGFRQYGIAAFDTCVKGTPPTANTSPIDQEHRTIYLRISPDYCANENLLTWSNYFGWNDLSGYEIFVSVNGAAYQFLDSTQAPDSTLIHTGLDLTNRYCYLIRAFDSTDQKSSTSNIGCALSAAAIQPAFHELTNVTVQDARVVASLWTDSTLNASFYTLERSLRRQGPYAEVSRLTNEERTRYTFVDESARVSETDYYYRVTIYDSCGFILGFSNVAKTVWLQGEFDKHFLINNLNWTTYEGWDSLGSGVQNYVLYRVTRRGKDASPIETFVDSALLDYRDPIEPYITTGSEICYFVEAREDTGNVLGIRSSSFSNLVCFLDNPKLYVPNAFRPLGFNPVFRPVLAFGDLDSYNLRIFNRLGQLVFETNAIDEGWDGTFGGGDAALGVYVWRIQYQNASGDMHEEYGYVTLLR